MRGKPNDKERVSHMIEAIENIFSYTENTEYSAFLEHKMMQDAVVKNFEVLGEAAYHVSKELKSRHEMVEWKQIEGLRHVLVHDYYKINPIILWNTKNKHLENLLRNLNMLVIAENWK